MMDMRSRELAGLILMEALIGISVSEIAYSI
jgi:hypothetical protein